LRKLLLLDVFAFQDTWWFIHLLQPFFLCVFLVVSGICCTFSRSNARRGLRMLAASAALTLVTWLASAVSGQDFYIFFNVLHVLAVGTLLVAGVERLEKCRGWSAAAVHVFLMALSSALIWLVSLIPDWPGPRSPWLLPFGIVAEGLPGMADYLPLIPWLGFFLLGAMIGRLAYGGRRTLYPGAPAWLTAASRPFEFIGRHSLLIYVLHQPVLLAVLFGLRGLGWL
jgi:uncharacterized membrane protein